MAIERTSDPRTLPTATRLRLSGSTPGRPRHDRVPQEPQLNGPTDPRWVLAVRVGQQLEGTLLRPERREQLIKTGKLLGLTAFDANLIIAIVQDQARRGYEPAYCPTAGERQLAMIPHPTTRQRLAGRLRDRKALRITAIVSLIIAAELLLLRWLM